MEKISVYPGFIDIFLNLSFLRSRHTMQFLKFVITYSIMRVIKILKCNKTQAIL